MELLELSWTPARECYRKYNFKLCISIFVMYYKDCGVFTPKLLPIIESETRIEMKEKSQVCTLKTKTKVRK